MDEYKGWIPTFVGNAAEKLKAVCLACWKWD